MRIGAYGTINPVGIMAGFSNKTGVGRAYAASFARGRDTVYLSAAKTFSAVTLLGEDLTGYYGTKKMAGSFSGRTTKGCADEPFPKLDWDEIHKIELPDRLKNWDGGYVFYHGERITQNEMLQLAVYEGKISREEMWEKPSAAHHKAFDAMVTEQAKPRYGWSNTKYSEDGRYVFGTGANGRMDWKLVGDEEMRASLDEIAGWLCSGIPAANVEKRYLDYLRTMDFDLYGASMQIGNNVRTYDLMTAAYEAGKIGEHQHAYDLDLLAMLFHEKGNDGFIWKLNHAKETFDFEELLQSYDKTEAQKLVHLRSAQMTRYGGIL